VLRKGLRIPYKKNNMSSTERQGKREGEQKKKKKKTLVFHISLCPDLIAGTPRAPADIEKCVAAIGRMIRTFQKYFKIVFGIDRAPYMSSLPATQKRGATQKRDSGAARSMIPFELQTSPSAHHNILTRAINSQEQVRD
jgi:hypothetical protein